MTLTLLVCILADVLVGNATFTENVKRMFLSIHLVVFLVELSAVIQISVILVTLLVFLILGLFRLFVRRRFPSVPAQINIPCHVCVFLRKNFLHRYTNMDEEEILYNEMKDLPDFDCMPIPARWFKRFNIAPRTLPTTREYLESGYTIKRATEIKDLPPLIIDEPQQNGKLLVPLPAEEIKVEVVSRPFEWDSSKPFPAVLPMLKELPVVD